MKYYVSGINLKDILDGDILELYTKDSKGYHWTQHTVEIDTND